MKLKLDISSEETWQLIVAAKLVNARRDLIKALALLLIPLAFWGCAIHVYRMKIPHEIVTNYKPTPHDCFTENGITLCDTWTPTADGTKEGGPTDEGWELILSAIIFALVGSLIAVIAVAQAIDAYASMRTAEYDAWQSIADEFFS